MPFLLSILHHWLAWLVTLGWITRVTAAHRGLPTIPNLLLPEYDRSPSASLTLTVIVPALNEQENVRACLESLLGQDYPHLQILAVDDRSTDSTGAVMDALASANPDKLQVIHVTQLPAGWLGKTHAMALAARSLSALPTPPDFFLFTDADILFHPSALRRALVNAESTHADHLVLMPTTIIRRWDEAALLAFFQIFGIFAARPWRVADSRARRDAIGIGAFNLIRRTAYDRIGGFDSFPMEIVEDLGLGRRVKQAGLRQRLAFGRDLVRVHWASGALGLVNVMTKNLFSAFNFHVPLALLAATWMAIFAVAPFAVIWLPGYTIPAALTITAMAYLYYLMSFRSGISLWNVLLAPFAGSLFIYALLRSMFVTLRQGGVNWRGTFYPLAELRRHTAPLLPRHMK